MKRLKNFEAPNLGGPMQPQLEAVDRAAATRDALLARADQADAAIEAVIAPTPAFHHRHPAIPANILGIGLLAPELFTDDPELYAKALEVEAERGEVGFTPEAVKTVYEDGTVSLGALRRLVENVGPWQAS